MIARRAPIRPRIHCHTLILTRPIRRRFSQSSGSASLWTLGAGAAPAIPAIKRAFDDLVTEIGSIAPCFPIQASQIQILRSPAEFYDTLKAKIQSAEHRIFLSTLYVGTTEYEFVDCIRGALRQKPNLKVSILTDALRGTRETPKLSCATLLASLVSEFGPDRVQIYMYHTPNLTGIRKAILPRRINEGWGLQHMKLYGFDDELIISGANLSNDYFTNRQDRYHLIKSKEITEYFGQVYDTTCRLSYRVLPEKSEPGGFQLEWPPNNVQPSPLSDPKSYIKQCTARLKPFLDPSRFAVSKTMSEQPDTLVFPLLQLTPLLRPDTSNELPAVRKVVTALALPVFAGHRWTFTAGYFNMTPDFRKLLLKTKPREGTVLAASPWANGFYGSKGVSGMLPAAYTSLGKRFLDAVWQAGMSEQIKLKEWRRGTVNQPGGWSYHAKGIWVTLPEETNPSMTVVGSSNYTKRSYSLDLEANVLIVTRSQDLQKRLADEERWLQEYATTVDRDTFAQNDRRVRLHVRIAMWIVTLVGGAL